MVKSTTDLLNELSIESCDINSFIDINKKYMIKSDINEFWERVIAESGMSKSNIINKSDFSYRYFYDVINGRKNPSRDKVLRLVITMHHSLDNCQEALRIADKASLHPKVKRDSIIIFGIENKYTVNKINEILKEYEEDIIS